MSAKTATKEFVATGRRKTSTARVRIKEGTGTFTINNRPHSDYCTTEQQRKMVVAPLSTAEKTGAVDVVVNVNGGAMALGHPIGATGAMIMGTLLDEMERRDLSVGMVTMCTGGGMAPATIIERI